MPHRRQRSGSRRRRPPPRRGCLPQGGDAPTGSASTSSSTSGATSPMSCARPSSWGCRPTSTAWHRFECDRRYGLEWDHVDPLVKGGPTSYANVAARCWPTRRAKTGPGSNETEPPACSTAPSVGRRDVRSTTPGVTRMRDGSCSGWAPLHGGATDRIEKSAHGRATGSVSGHSPACAQGDGSLTGPSGVSSGRPGQPTAATAIPDAVAAARSAPSPATTTRSGSRTRSAAAR